MSKKSLLATAVGTAFAATLAAPVVSAAENPFALSSLASGYQVADSSTPAKPMEGKCGEGMCGAKMKEGMCGMFMADANKDGKISKEECDQQRDAMFTKMDTNKDGFIDTSEMGKVGDGRCGAYKPKTPEGKCGAAK